MKCLDYDICTDVILSSWPDEVDSSGVKVRNISYTLSLTNPLGPKTSPSTERQVSVVYVSSTMEVVFACHWLEFFKGLDLEARNSLLDFGIICGDQD